MISQGDLIAAARELAGTTGGPPPTQASLRRAVSTTDYALFHCMAENCADMLVGTLGTNRSQPAWQQAYRALQHAGHFSMVPPSSGADKTRFNGFPCKYSVLLIGSSPCRRSANPPTMIRPELSSNWQ